MRDLLCCAVRTSKVLGKGSGMATDRVYGCCQIIKSKVWSFISNSGSRTWHYCELLQIA